MLVSLLAVSARADAIPHMGCFEVASRRHNVELGLLVAVAAVESNWQADARSSAGAHGIMQIRWPLTARHMGARRVAELYNPCLNIDIGAAYLAELGTRYSGDERMMLAAYNYGPTRLRDFRDVPDSVRGYIDRVLAARNHLAGDRLTVDSEGCGFRGVDGGEYVWLRGPGGQLYRRVTEDGTRRALECEA